MYNILVFYLIENYVWRQCYYIRGNTDLLQCGRVEGKPIKR